MLLCFEKYSHFIKNTFILILNNEAKYSKKLYFSLYSILISIPEQNIFLRFSLYYKNLILNKFLLVISLDI